MQNRIFKSAIQPLDEDEALPAPHRWRRATRLGPNPDWEGWGDYPPGEFVFLDGPESPLYDWWAQMEPAQPQPVQEPVLYPPDFNQYVDQLIQQQSPGSPVQSDSPPVQSAENSQSSGTSSYEEALESPDTPSPPPLPRRTSSPSPPPVPARRTQSNGPGIPSASQTARNPVRPEQINVSANSVVNLANLPDIPLPSPEPLRRPNVTRSGRPTKPPAHLKDYQR